MTAQDQQDGGPEESEIRAYDVNNDANCPLWWEFMHAPENPEGGFLRGFLKDEPRCSLFTIQPMSATHGYLAGAFMFDDEEGKADEPVLISELAAKALQRTKDFLRFCLARFGIQSGPLAELLLNGGGVALILNERREQIHEHQNRVSVDAQYEHNELVRAAGAYASASGPDSPCPEDFPWPPAFWKPKTRVENLAIAGALIAAEIDAEQWRQRYPIQVGAEASLPELREAFVALHEAWLGAGHRSDMNIEMDELARRLGVDPLNPRKPWTTAPGIPDTWDETCWPDNSTVELTRFIVQDHGDGMEGWVVDMADGADLAACCLGVSRVRTVPEASVFQGLAMLEVWRELCEAHPSRFDVFNLDTLEAALVGAKKLKEELQEGGLQYLKDEATGAYIGSGDRWVVQVQKGVGLESSWEYAGRLSEELLEPVATSPVQALAYVFTGEADLKQWLRVLNGPCVARYVFNLYHG